MSAQFFARKGAVSIAAILIVFCGLLGRAPAVTAQTQTAVEYYYWVWNYYFVTSFPPEIAALDGGAFGGAWKRTGQTFDVWTGPTNGALPTCRFFSTIFAPKSSHFYTPYAAECASLKAGVGWQFEAVAFYVQLPDANGNCTAGTDVLYRLYNNGMGGAPNHRFTRSAALFNQMRAAGWVFEGNGLTGAFACVPTSPPPAPTAEGGWTGSTTNGERFFGAILDTGAYYFLYTAPMTNSITGVLQGDGSSVNGVFSSSDARDFHLGGVVPATVTASYAARATLSAILNESGMSVGFNATYVPAYDNPVTLASYAGTYQAPPSFAVTVDPTGAVTGSFPGCVFTGTAGPRGGVGVLNLTLAFGGGAGCVLGTSTLTGIAFFYDAAHTRLALITTNPNNAWFWFLSQ
jgi:hypothetical protein